MGLSSGPEVSLPEVWSTSTETAVTVSPPSARWSGNQMLDPETPCNSRVNGLSTGRCQCGERTLPA